MPLHARRGQSGARSWLTPAPAHASPVTREFRVGDRSRPAARFGCPGQRPPAVAHRGGHRCARSRRCRPSGERIGRAISRWWPPATDEQFRAAAGGGPASQWADIAAVTVADRVDPVDRVAVGQRIVFAPGAAGYERKIGLRIVLTHELFHYAARADTALDAPRWLAEGVADFVARPHHRRAGRCAAGAVDAAVGRRPGHARAAALVGIRPRLVVRPLRRRHLRDGQVARPLSGHLRSRTCRPAARRLHDVLGVDPAGLLVRWHQWAAASLTQVSRVLLVTNDFPPRRGGIQSYLGEFVAPAGRRRVALRSPCTHRNGRAPTPLTIGPCGRLSGGAPSRHADAARSRRSIRRMRRLIAEHGIDTVWFGAAARWPCWRSAPGRPGRRGCWPARTATKWAGRCFRWPARCCAASARTPTS